MQLYLLSLLCWFAEDLVVSEASRNYTENELNLYLFEESGYPEQGDIPLLNRKVFKGTRVSIREHPYILSIRRQVAHYCIGTLLTKNIVLTVAHPLIDVPIYELSVAAGENYADRGITLLTVMLLIIHEHFDHYTLANDIALIRIYEDLTYKGSIKAIGLVSPKASLEGKTAFVTGWGRCDRTGRELCLPRTSRYFPGEKQDPMLRSVSFIITMSSNYCDVYRRNEVYLQPGMICVGTAREEDPVCPCLAVPGAPLLVDARLAALQSWGFGCGYSYDLPLVYTSIQYFQPWLVHNIPILRNITNEHLKVLFQATKAYILTQWLKKTRLLMPEHDIQRYRHITPLKSDRELCKLRGVIYDIRDYLYNGTHQKRKIMLYQRLKKKYVKNEMIRLYATMGPQIVSPYPFLVADNFNFYHDSNSSEFGDTNEETDADGGNVILTEIYDDSKSKTADDDSSNED